ncbi:MAG: phosphoribosylformimino-5-aminoimidazole carboxamide ribotide isomerase [Lachnospiraceae bacterium]|nr:phosphoribosylformimino-5-aminoimidazole carboxamide ribotide isomerase [Lachnospiraceae bacterium]
MKLCPCIDIHNGTVKQIVGSTLGGVDPNDEQVFENYKSVMGAAHFASIFKAKGLTGGHVINLNSRDSGFFKASENEVFSALSTYPKGLTAGGGIDIENAKDYLDKGASHVIMTSALFRNKKLSFEYLREFAKKVGSKYLIIDLSCKKEGDEYFVFTDRWQKKTDTVVSTGLFQKLYAYCEGFLVHGIASEGKKGGFDENLVKLLSLAAPVTKPITYAGGIASIDDIKKIKAITNGNIDITIGSALSIYGGSLSIDEVIAVI